MIARRDNAPAPSDLLPVRGVAWTAGPELTIEECRDPGVSKDGCHEPPTRLLLLVTTLFSALGAVLNTKAL
jgi:hypothetical protein